MKSPLPTAKEAAQSLKDQGFMQTSRAHLMLGRVPPGKTAINALYEATMERYTYAPAREFWEKHQRKWCNMLGERGCAGFYARVYAKGDDAITVSAAVLRAFRELGGESA